MGTYDRRTSPREEAAADKEEALDALEAELAALRSGTALRAGEATSG
jgi:hypothetical protein